MTTFLNAKPVNISYIRFLPYKMLILMQAAMFSPPTTLCGHRKLTLASSGRVVCHNTGWLGVDYVCWFNLNYPGCLVCISCHWLPDAYHHEVTRSSILRASTAMSQVPLRLLMIISQHSRLFGIWFGERVSLERKLFQQTPTSIAFSWTCLILNHQS